MRMSLGRIQKSLTATAITAAAFTLALAGSPREARAEGPVTGTGKGIVGGALLGGEAVTITMAAVGVQKGWPYLVFGGLDAVGGGIGGYFVEQASGTTAEPPIYMLAGGMALVIPALVLSLNATSYRPPETDREEPVTNEPAPTPPAAGAPLTTSREGPKPRARTAKAAVPHIPLSLLDVYKGHIAIGLPAFEVRPLYTQREVWQYGVSQGSEVRVPVFQAMF